VIGACQSGGAGGGGGDGGAFHPTDALALGRRCDQLLALHRRARSFGRQLHANAMAHPVGWETSAAAYARALRRPSGVSGRRPTPRGCAAMRSARGGLGRWGQAFDRRGGEFRRLFRPCRTDRAVPVLPDGRKEWRGIPLIIERDGDIWHIHVGGLTPGTVYGFRVHGPYAPEQGHRFNPHKLLRPLCPRAGRAAEMVGRADGLQDRVLARPTCPLTRVTAPLPCRIGGGGPVVQLGR
jgi:hypothetical protein